MAGIGRAQGDDCDVKAGPPSADFEHYASEQWPREAERFKDSRENVSRESTRLQLKLEKGDTVTLADCPRGEDAHVFLYERYDEAGRFYVVRRPAFKDFSYTLVMRATGKQYTVYGTPIWTQDKARFLTVACSWLPPRGTLTVHAPASGGIATEAEIPLRTCLDETETCTARWDNPSWISVTCTRSDGSSRKGSEFVVLKGSDGVWKTFGR
ncbi:MAG TPA: hypothetical protein VEC60_10275 [Reyranella sp.]|nr:hypothetical protein [Reyranella sp.]